MTGETAHIELLLRSSSHDLSPIVPHPLSFRYKRHTKALELFLRRRRLEHLDPVGVFLSHVVLPRFDVVHLHGGVLWPELYDRIHDGSCRYFYTAHWLHEVADFTEEERPLVEYYNQLMLRVAARSDCVIAVSRWIQTELARKGVRAVRIPPGLDLEAARTADARRFQVRYGVPPGFLLWAGWPGKVKRPEWVWRLARQLPEERFLAITDASEAALSEAGLLPVPANMKVLPILPHKDFLDALAASKVLLSTTRKEGYGISVAEAVVCGARAVASQAGGPAEFVKPGVTGELYDPFSFDDFERHVVRAVSQGRIDPEVDNTIPRDHSERWVLSKIDALYAGEEGGS